MTSASARVVAGWRDADPGQRGPGADRIRAADHNGNFMICAKLIPAEVNAADVAAVGVTEAVHDDQLGGHSQADDRPEAPIKK